MNVAFDQIRQIWRILGPQAPRAEAPAYVYARPQAEVPPFAYSQPYNYGSYPGFLPGTHPYESLKRMTSLVVRRPAWDLVFWLWSLDGAGDPVSLRGACSSRDTSAVCGADGP
ncbi:hypothetical protein PI124_g21727 [Phytophthora idaei]|nr:hypothetical protein PI125_g23638 [Phytophthora idaei]KAG3233196.1 hypothetical protein PI124_g21727 [Phytophthora idaei]